ncbi:MAG TPA: 23S rRNA (adenine(2030)-N(6))-methyltransferase RlmJ [Pseudomonadales bacterium]|nr:23S rRNA (adenine(2030)-N(6))-methyltransferase RlmJ [Pseudomonadales bacterium]
MLSYQHGYHAGNHADVLKHVILIALLEHLARKPKPFSYIDTHAGAGLYDLREREARKNREFESGIGRLWERDDLPPLVARYVAAVRACNDATGRLKHYPGSPRIAREFLRSTDPVDLFELHPAESRRLERVMADRGRLRVHQEDGFHGCIGLLPPPSRRGLVFMDPPYEVKADFGAVVKTLKDAHKRFATGTYAIWYPVTTRDRVDRLRKQIIASGIRDSHRFELCVAADTEDFGMTGSGLIVVRPPYTLHSIMGELLPWLTAVLGGEGAFSSAESLIPE